MRPNERIAGWLPGPGLFGPLWPPGARTLTCKEVIPASLAISPAFFAAVIAAVGLLSRRCCLTTCPPDASATVSEPVMSVMWMMVLLYDA